MPTIGSIEKVPIGSFLRPRRNKLDIQRTESNVIIYLTMIWTAGNFVLKSYYSKLEPFVSLSLSLPLITELKFIIFVILSTLLILVVCRTCFRH